MCLNIADGWGDLPSDLLEKIFGTVSPARDEMKEVGGVCHQWKSVFGASVTKIQMARGFGEIPRWVRMCEYYPKLRRYFSRVCLLLS